MAELEKRFVEKSGNLVVEARNESGAPLEVHLRGAIAHAFTTKGFELPAGAFDWKAGEVRISVPAKSRLRFFLEGHSEGELLVRFFDPAGPADQPEILDEVLAISGLEQRKVFRWEAGPGWQPGSPDELREGESGFSFRWNGLRRASAGDAVPAIDAELKKQLEALGYVR